MSKEFRVRKTDDTTGNWTVADSDYKEKIAKLCAAYNAPADVIKTAQAFMDKMRVFEHGATRDTDVTKLDYEAFNNPLVDKCYGEYLNKHRQTANGLRDGDNWQNLFGDKHTDVCMKSLCRHVVDARLAHRGYRSEQSIEDDLCAIIFNAKAYLLKLLLDENIVVHETTPGYAGNLQEIK